MRFLAFTPLLFALGVVADLQFVDFPHLIVPIKKSQPDKNFGTQTSGEISNDVWTEISFDVRSDIPATTCRVNFHINTNPTKNAPRSLSGVEPYNFLIYRITPTMDKDKDSWNHSPSIINYIAEVTLTQAGDVSIKDGWFPCPNGTVAQFLMTPVNSKKAFKYTWFELDYPEEEGGPHGITLEMHD
ncbi:hypothetical protein HBI95_162270 [Parastagonospora nodorum]|nr:hypothetical protein HBI95_162270 [Parastagonospora nodorum]